MNATLGVTLRGMEAVLSLAWITGAVAAMAEPPQIEDPTPIKVASAVDRKSVV